MTSCAALRPNRRSGTPGRGERQHLQGGGEPRSSGAAISARNVSTARTAVSGRCASIPHEAHAAVGRVVGVVSPQPHEQAQYLPGVPGPESQALEGRPRIAPAVRDAVVHRDGRRLARLHGHDRTPSSTTRNSIRRCLRVKNSRVPCVASPSPTTRTSDQMARRGARPERSEPGSTLSSGMARSTSQEIRSGSGIADDMTYPSRPLLRRPIACRTGWSDAPSSRPSTRHRRGLLRGRSDPGRAGRLGRAPVRVAPNRVVLPTERRSLPQS